jgi:hypothetical protein
VRDYSRVLVVRCKYITEPESYDTTIRDLRELGVCVELPPGPLFMAPTRLSFGNRVIELFISAPFAHQKTDSELNDIYMSGAWKYRITIDCTFCMIASGSFKNQRANHRRSVVVRDMGLGSKKNTRSFDCSTVSPSLPRLVRHERAYLSFKFHLVSTPYVM